MGDQHVLAKLAARAVPAATPTEGRVSQGEDLMALQLDRVGLAGAYQREFRFDPSRRWRFDFAFPEDRLALEVEGGTWTNGRHSRGSGFERDAEKYAQAAVAGWRVIRATTGQVKAGLALQWVEQALGRIKTKPPKPAFGRAGKRSTGG